ncbi:uncharacterized protein LOC126907852 isoform X2 [Daktulosphaira vitifoliae]|nr:uncharacterized protein LOC126907852 isoform X2 [Daktulosphaira vitifoliae]
MSKKIILSSSSFNIIVLILLNPNAFVFCISDKMSEEKLLANHIGWTNDEFNKIQIENERYELVYQVVLMAYKYEPMNGNKYERIEEILIPSRSKEHTIENEEIIRKYIFKYKNKNVNMKIENLEIYNENNADYQTVVKERIAFIRNAAIYIFNNKKSSFLMCGNDIGIIKCYLRGLINYIDSPTILKQRGGCELFDEKICSFQYMNQSRIWENKLYMFSASTDLCNYP